jgi:hypothetical protein
MNRRAHDRIEDVPRKTYDGLCRIAWRIAVDCGLQTHPLDDVITSVYLSGLQHGVNAAEIAEKAK